jgi:hypothetical protein
MWVEELLNRCSDGSWVEPRQEARNGGLMRGGGALKAQSASHVTGLAPSPFGYSQHRGVVGQ